jgi:hypothetical protein
VALEFEDAEQLAPGRRKGTRELVFTALSQTTNQV